MGIFAPEKGISAQNVDVRPMDDVVTHFLFSGDSRVVLESGAHEFGHMSCYCHSATRHSALGAEYWVTII